uniref:Uncharacterized protein n=2 Tax=Cajanus cajan TaxID=3821 RepID=A0A151R1L1_CAJCA|nr:hypothetical protein KK1_042399 [Cajanus cajan]
MEEKLLKEEIDNLKKELEKESAINSNKEFADEAGGDQTSTHAILQQKEKELEQLIRDLDDKVRFGQKAVQQQENLLLLLIGHLPDLAHLRILEVWILQTDLDLVVQEICGCVLVMTEDSFKVAGKGDGFLVAETRIGQIQERDGEQQFCVD